MDLTEALPLDMLANILRRLPARDLAASCCVRKTWRAVVDARGLLLPHVLPHSVHGIFVNYIDYERPHCFTRPSARDPAIDGNLDFLPGYTEDLNPIADHCNGLVLYESFRELCVASPATRRWDRFHDCNYNGKDYDSYYPYLVFDPAVSPHYEVFSIPDVPNKLVSDDQQDLHGSLEWPPSLWTLDVFSSATRQWQKRSFLPQGEAGGTVTSVRADPREPESMCFGGATRRYGVYLDGSLYVHCRGVFVARFSLSSGKYQVIKMPREIQGSKNARFLGKSEKGVSLATMHEKRRLMFFNLAESDGQIGWVLKHHVDLDPLTSLLWHDFKGFKKTWTLDDGSNVMMVKKNTISWEGGGREEEDEESEENDDEENDDEEDDDDEKEEYDGDGDGDDDDDDDDDGVERGEEEESEEKEGEGENDGIQIRENMEWNSDDDNVLNIEDDYSRCGTNLYFLGFHPYKEVVFLGVSSFIGVAYHLRSSKIQYLGKIHPKDYYRAHKNRMYEGYPYTPCMIGELQNHALTSRRRG